jgi:adenine-specific DNA-methyltransferase
MPVLNWIGKDKVTSHHLSVPCRVLNRSYTHGDGAEDNMIVHGDNLDALKSLLPRFEGKVNLVYIDPPYNTGNEAWVYNDNVNSPEMKKWLGIVVGREGEDLGRHDKWLCMMYPRLKLLSRLLADDGAIFMSIDDSECMSLKLVCDEIFGASCFVADISWQRTHSSRNDSKGIVREVEHILAYGRRPGWRPGRLPRTEGMDARYSNPDNDRRPWKSSDAFAPGAKIHQGMVYAVQHPFTGEMVYPAVDRCWCFSQGAVLEAMRGWCGYELRDLHDAGERARICGVPENKVRQGVKGIVLSSPLKESRAQARRALKRGQWPVLCFTREGKGGIRRKTFLDGARGRAVTNFWPCSETGHTDEAKKEMLAIFGGTVKFSTPKPTRLIERILEIFPDKGALVLDSFAGSGTTAHAVLNMNRRDGGSRRFILVEMDGYAEGVTAERVRRVIGGYGGTPGTGGGFAFYELGGPLLLEDGSLNRNLGLDRLREYIWHTETRSEWPGSSAPPFLGESCGAAYYLVCENGSVAVLDKAFTKQMHPRAGRHVVYACSSALSEDERLRLHIEFKKIPRDIVRL